MVPEEYEDQSPTELRIQRMDMSDSVFLRLQRTPSASNEDGTTMFTCERCVCLVTVAEANRYNERNYILRGVYF